MEERRVEDLWGFKDSGSFRSNKDRIPETMLNTQFRLIKSKTDGAITGRTIHIRIRKEENFTYNMASIYEFVVPNLDNFSTTALILYSNAETDYPVALTVGKCFEDDGVDFQPDYVCHNTEEFTACVKEALRSSSIMDKLETLYAKALVC